MAKQKNKIKIVCGVLSLLGILAAGFALYFFVLSKILALPDNFSYTANVVSYDNFYDIEKGSFQGEQQSESTYSFKVIEENNDNLIIENIFDVKTKIGKQIFKVKRLYGIDAFSGQHISTLGDRERDGYLFAPRMKGLFAQQPDKSHFVYWHINYNFPIEMEFIAEEVLFGLPVYRYHSNFKADQTEELSTLPGIGEGTGMELDVEISLWIEPVSGRLIKYEDSATAYYYDLLTGERLYPWNKFRNSFANGSINKHALLGLQIKQKIDMINYGVLGIVGLIIFLIVLKNKFQVHREKVILGRSGKGKKVWILPLVAFILTLIVTAVVVFFINQLTYQIRQTEFESETERINDAIADRLEIYANMLYGGRGVFDSSEKVTRDGWKAYVESLQIQQSYPGIQGFGYSLWLDPEELESHILEIREEGFPNYVVHPIGERDQYTSIIFLEPFDERNIEAFGFDMYQESTRKAGIDIAIDSGHVALTGKVTLVQEIDSDVQSGFLMYVPVYEKGKELKSADDRREAFLGLVYSPFRMNNFVNGIIPSGSTLINIEIFDERQEDYFNDSHRMYGNIIQDELLFQSIKYIEFGGHTWTVRYSSPSEYGLDLLRSLAVFITLFVGLFFGLAWFLVLYALNIKRAEALELAESMTVGLLKRAEENEKIQKVLEKTNNDLVKKASALAEKIKEIESINKYMVGREMRIRELKTKLKELKSKE